MWEYRILGIIAGAPRTGKTFFAETMCSYVTKSTGKPTLVYNRGLPTDYESFEKVDFLTINQTAAFIQKRKGNYKAYLDRPRILFFSYNRKIYPVEYFSTVLHGKCVVMRRHENEKELYRAISEKIGGIQLILDDAKKLFRYGLSDEAITLFDRINHAGENNKKVSTYGNDIYVMFHSLDAVNEIIFDYATHLFLTRAVNTPDLSKIKIPGLNEAIKKAYNELRKDEKFTLYQVEIFSENPCELLKISPSKTRKIREKF